MEDSLITKKRLSLSRPSMQLEEYLTLEQFSQLMNTFHEHKRDGRTTATSRVTTDEFRRALSSLLQRPEDDEKISLLCNKVDTEGDGFIEEEELCSYFLHQFRERDSLSNIRPLPFQDTPKFRHNMYSKETLCRLMQANNPTRFITVSKDGVAGTWSGGLQFQRGMELEGAVNYGSSGRGRRGSLWVTDCALMVNCNKLVLSTTSRELVFYDIANPAYKCQYRLHDFPSVVLCTTHYHNQQDPSSTSYLLCGDIAGSIMVFSFLYPLAGLFAGSNKEEDISPIMVAYNCIAEHSQYVTMQCMLQLHPGWVRSVSYLWHNHSFLSCANSSINSLVMVDINKKKKSYVFKIRKGVLCFSYSHKADLLVTGSMDHVVRVWNPYVPTRPVALLTEHSTAILNVIIARDMGLIFSYSQDSVLCAWDMYEYVPVQTITVKFPFSQRLPDFGPCPLSYLKLSHKLTILCNEYMAELKLGASSLAKEAVNQSASCHRNPLCAALYNQHFHQVISGCERGVVKVWDIDSGNQVFQFMDCHGNHELTAMALDSTGRRLITGSRAGEIKVWNYMNSECVKLLPSSTYSEVTGVMHLLDRSRFLTVGWDKRIRSFIDDPDVFNARTDGLWNSSESHHRDDILCVSYCPPCYLATGSFDGELKVWNMDTENLIVQFQSIRKLNDIVLPSLSKKSSVGVDRTPFWSSRISQCESKTSFSSRPASRRLSTYRIRSSSVHAHHVPVDQVQFLRSRMRTRHKGSAVLVSSERGVARFWDIFGNREPLGSFPMTQFDNENVLAMKTDPSNNFLLAGDTAGFISVFTIKNYHSSSQTQGGGDESRPPIMYWRAHDGEILSIDYVAHETQPLILSGSGDCMVRLWTMQGHFVGTFGQEQPWDLKVSSTFQHPKTPWGEVHRPNSQLHEIGIATPTEGMGVAPVNNNAEGHTPKTVITRVGESDEGRSKHNLHISSLSSSTSSISTSSLPQALTDKSLGSDYSSGIHKRMAGRHDRRMNFAEVNVKATERFGLLCSPFQALHILKVDDLQDIQPSLDTTRT